MNISNISDYIRAPLLALNWVMKFVFKNFVSIMIIVTTIIIIYYVIKLFRWLASQADYLEDEDSGEEDNLSD